MASVWIAGTTVAILLSTSAVGLVGRRVAEGPREVASTAELEPSAPSSPAPPSTAEPGTADPGEVVDQPDGAPPPLAGATTSSTAAPRSSGAAAQPPPSSLPAAPPAPVAAPASVDEVYSTLGGTVGVRCTGSTIGLSFATPASGWRLHGSPSTGPVQVEVRFEPAQDAHGAEVRVRAVCSGGVPVEEIRETD